MKCIPLLSCFFLTTLVTFRSCDAYPNKYKKNYTKYDIQEYAYHDNFIPIQEEKFDRMDIAEIFFGEELERHPTPDLGTKPTSENVKTQDRCWTPPITKKCETPDLKK